MPQAPGFSPKNPFVSENQALCSDNVLGDPPFLPANWFETETFAFSFTISLKKNKNAFDALREELDFSFLW